MQTETLSSKTIYKGRIFDIRVDEIREGEIEYKREIVVHGGSAVVIPVFDDLSIALVQQYRHPAGQLLLEIPAGSLETGEDPSAGALRELEEEIGVRAGKIEKLCEFYVSPGFLSEKMHLYLATELTETEQNLDPDEIIYIERLPLKKALEMVRDNEIHDAKTIIAITLAASRFGFSLSDQ